MSIVQTQRMKSISSLQVHPSARFASEVETKHMRRSASQISQFSQGSHHGTGTGSLPAHAKVTLSCLTSMLEEVSSKIDGLTFGQQRIEMLLEASGQVPSEGGSPKKHSQELYVRQLSDYCRHLQVPRYERHGRHDATETSRDRVTFRQSHVSSSNLSSLNQNSTSLDAPEVHSQREENQKLKEIRTDVVNGMKLRAFCRDTETWNSDDPTKKSFTHSGSGIYRSGHGQMRHPKIQVSDDSLIDDGSQNIGNGFHRIGRVIRESLPLMKYSRPVIMFDLMGLVMLLKDSITVPFSISWKTPVSPASMTISFITAIFWTLDMCARFVIAVEEDDAISANLNKVICHYLKHWFAVDVTLVCFDWANIAIDLNDVEGDASPAILRLLRLMKASRVVRIYAVFRAGKLAHFKALLLLKMQGYAVIFEFLWSLAQLVVFILWLNHIGACAWVYLQANKWIQDSENNWEHELAQMHNVHARTLDEAGITDVYKYMIAYYWSISTMLTGESFLVPMTPMECIFAIVYVLFGILFVTIIISSMAAMLMTINEDKREETEKMQKLRQFLSQNDVDPYCRVQIQRQAMERLTTESRLAEEDVEAIALLSVELRDQLRYQLYNPLLSVQPLWRACDHVDDQVIKALCRLAVSSQMRKPGDLIFEEYQRVDESYTIVWGGLQYTTMKHVSPWWTSEESDSAENTCTVDVRSSQSNTAATFVTGPTHSDGSVHRKLVATPVGAGETVCEFAVWAEWTTSGFLEAETLCELLACSSRGLMEVMYSISCNARDIMLGYASALRQYKESERNVFLSDVSQTTEYDSIVTFMPQRTRVLMSKPSLSALKKGLMKHGGSTGTLHAVLGHGGWVSFSREQLQDLEKEIVEGKCNLGQDESGQMLRVVRIVALHLSGVNGLICVHMAEVHKGKTTFVVRLPGRKLRMQETLKHCTDQLLDKHFRPFKSAISVQYGKVDVELAPSKAYHIPTKYIRLVVEGSMDFHAVSNLLTTYTSSWGQEMIECFACKDSDDHSVNIFAWLTPEQHATLVNSGAEGDELVEKWITGFNLKDLESLGQDVVASVAANDGHFRRESAQVAHVGSRDRPVIMLL